jgi:hypothetical protein
MDTMVELIGFAPDMDITTPGALRDQTSNVRPTIRGMAGDFTSQDVGLDALAAECRGAAAARLIDDSARIFAGTQTKLYERSGTSWTDISRAGNYVGGTENRWRFTQYGNISFAVNREDATQVSTGAAFSDLGGGSPKASIIESNQNFIMVFDYNDGVNDYSDGWWCCALGNYTSWTPSIATQAANGRLLSTPGKIRAGRSLGDSMVAYKERSMYLGRYVGPPLIWQWENIPGDIGAVSNEAVIDIGTAHIFRGFDDFYIYDGSRPVSIGNPIREWFNGRIKASTQHKIQAGHDRTNSNVYFFYQNQNATGNELNEAVIYNYKVNRWGITTGSVYAILDYLNGGATYDQMGTFYITWDDLPLTSYDSPFWTSQTLLLAVIDGTNKLKTLTGDTVTSVFHTGYIGDDEEFTTVTRIRPRFLKSPNSGTATLYSSTSLSGTPYSPPDATLTDYRFDFMKSGRWHRTRMTFNGNVEFGVARVYYEQDGSQ